MAKIKRTDSIIDTIIRLIEGCATKIPTMSQIIETRAGDGYNEGILGF